MKIFVAIAALIIILLLIAPADSVSVARADGDNWLPGYFEHIQKYMDNNPEFQITIHVQHTGDTVFGRITKLGNDFICLYTNPDQYRPNYHVESCIPFVHIDYVDYLGSVYR